VLSAGCSANWISHHCCRCLMSSAGVAGTPSSWIYRPASIQMSSHKYLPHHHDEPVVSADLFDPPGAAPPGGAGVHHHPRGSPATALRHRDLLARVLEVEAAEQPPHTRACQSRDGSPCDQARCDQARWFGAVQWTSGMIFCGLFSRVWTRSMLIRPLVWRRFPIRRRGAGPSTEYPT
jgi:hypothetical protein